MSAAPRPFLPSDLRADRARSSPLIRAALAVALSDPMTGGAQSVVRQRWDNDAAALEILARSASAPANTTTSTWAGALAHTAVAEFIASLTESATAKLIAAAQRVSLDGVQSTTFPRRQGAPSGAIPWVGEGGAIPVKQYALEGVTVGPARKLASIAALTSEVARSTNAETVIGTLLREDVTASLDASVFSDAAASSTRPAGILNGVAPLTATSGGGESAMNADMSKLASAAALGGSDVVYVAHPSMAAVAKLQLGTNRAPTIWPASALPVGTIIAVAPAAFVSAFGPDPRLDRATDATLHFEDANPLAIGTAGSPNTVAAPTRSAFQSDLIGVRMILDAAWAMRSANAVAWIEDASWG